MKPYKSIPARQFLVLVGSLFLCFFTNAVGPDSAEAASQRRIALVVGNNGYPQMRLQNAVNDARAMFQTLTQAGFQVEKVEDATLIELAKALDSFIGRLGSGDVGLFFYSGHGIQVEGENYGSSPIDVKSDMGRNF